MSRTLVPSGRVTAGGGPDARPHVERLPELRL
jgi:hypothetical protein